MKVKTIKYLRRKNLGNYNHEEVELFAELNDEDNPTEAIAALKGNAADALGIEPPKPKPEPELAESNFDSKPF